MKKSLLVVLFSLMCSVAMSQIDTIYASGQAIPCTVLEVGGDIVKFTHPGEAAVNSLYINAINKIKFRSGRLQEFAASTSFRKLRTPIDFENVTISSIDSEVKGLYKLGEVSSKAKGTTEFSNQERVKMRAMRKLKMDAAMMGANIVYIYDIRSDGNKVDWMGFGASSSAETSISGVSYTNSPVTMAEVQTLLAKNRGQYNIVKIYSLQKGDTEIRTKDVSMEFDFNRVVDESGVVFLQGNIARVKADRFQVIFTDSHSICIRFTDKSAVYVYQINI